VHDTRRSRLVLGLLLVAALALITIDYRGGAEAPLRGLRSVGGAVFGSVENVASLVTRPVAAVADGVTGNTGSQAKIDSLQRQVLALRAQLSQQQLTKYQDQQLKQLLQLAARGRYRVVAANVVAAGGSYDDSITIDAGRDDGVKPDMTVLNGQGLVGSVTSVTATTATVLLSTDASVTVGVRLAGTGQIGVVSGTGKTMSGSGLLRLQVFDVNAVLRPGQQLVTFGSVGGGSSYVPGVPVGVITKVEGTASSLTKLALVRPYANDTALGIVGVIIVPPRHNPRFAVLPPAPAPQVTVTVTASPSGQPTGAATPTPGATGPGH
jgi:rod shape-determining protein MreC